MYVATNLHTSPDVKPIRVNLYSEMMRKRRADEAELLKNEEQALRLKQQIKEANDAIAWATKRVAVLSFSDIISRISRATGVTPLEILSAQRSRRIVLARQAVAYWTCRMTLLSLPQIGRRLKRDHTSIMHARRVYVEKRAEMGRSLRNLDGRYGPGGRPVSPTSIGL